METPAALGYLDQVSPQNKPKLSTLNSRSTKKSTGPSRNEQPQLRTLLDSRT